MVGPLRRALLLLLAVLATAPGGPAARAEDDVPAAKRQRFAELDREIVKAFVEKRWADVEKHTREQMALIPTDEGPPYNLACALARQGKAADAIAYLAKSVELGFSDADHMARDVDLDSLREEKGYREVLALARAAQEKRLANLYEPPTEVKGVKTVEGDPAGGLRWRLRIAPDASAKKPHRLVVWLHPSGGSMNPSIEPMARDLAAKGWALLVPTSKRWESWTDDDAKRLLEKTLPDAARVEGLDAARPVLLGFSAGGQAALVLWSKDPTRFGGLVLDAAYPVDAEAYAAGRIERMRLPAGDLTKTPFFVLVGDADPGHAVWKSAEKPFRDAGIPLKVTYVPDGQHQWLFGADEGAALLAWLGEIAAGECPGAAEKSKAGPAMSEPLPGK